MFYHPVLQTIVIREGTPESGNNITTISTRIFSKIVYESMHWNEACQFRFRGITKVRDGAKIIIFTLDEHQVVTRKRKKTVLSSQDAEGMISTKEPQWIDVNNRALEWFGEVPAIVVCDNCKQAVIANKDWIDQDLNKDYAEWADHNHTAIMPAKVRKPKYKSSVGATIGILEKGFFHDLEERKYFSLRKFNADLWEGIEKLNRKPFEKKEHNRYYYWEEDRLELMALPSMQYQYMERSIAKVSSDFHVRFDNAYYSIDKAYSEREAGRRDESRGLPFG